MSLPSPLLAPATEALAPFVEAGLLHHADVQVAGAIGRHVPGTDPAVLLAAAFAVRATRLGHVCVDPRTLPDTVAADPSAELPWPDPARWLALLEASDAVARVPDDAHQRLALDGGHRRAGAVGSVLRPLVLHGGRLYLERYWRHEQVVGDDLVERATGGPSASALPATEGAVARVLDRLFGPAPAGDVDLQRRAAEVALERRIVVVAGGPGTGKTRTVARLLAALHLLAGPAGPVPQVALAAPTGKAAQRMTEAVHQGVVDAGLAPAEAEPLLAVRATTLHRLLGPTGGPGFRHDRRDPLPHDVVVVDEASMISLPLMARLLDAVRPEARVVLVGDPDQLASVEAGAVLGDVVGGRTRGADGPLAPSIVVLERVHRFAADSAIAALAAATRVGDVEAVLAVLHDGGEEVTWVRPDDAPAVAALRATVLDAAVESTHHALAGDAGAALAAAARCKVLAATRRGPFGLWDWQDDLQARVARQVPGLDVGRTWYPGRPVLVTRNDRLNGLANGDTGITVERDGVLRVAFADPGSDIRELPTARLDAVDTWWAMTIHKSQGSEYDHAVVSLPWARSRILTRELLYTGVTRAKRHVTVVASEEAVRAAVARPVARASGLGPRLWSV